MNKYTGAHGYQAFRILQIAFILLPILAGLDKFFYFLTDWSKYLSPFAIEFLQGNARTFMIAVGVIEIIAGIGVIFKPKFFAYVVVLWLLAIIINLLLLRAYYDIAARDVGLLLSALALARLSHKYSA